MASLASEYLAFGPFHSPCLTACIITVLPEYVFMNKTSVRTHMSTHAHTHKLSLSQAQNPSEMLEREKLYIFSSHLGLIRCLTSVRVSAIIYFQAFLDKHRNTTNIILPHKLNHGSRMLSKQP